jgi:3-dehydrosphinganine reductase
MSARHALITGGSSGIGLSVAAQLASDRWNLSLVARRSDRLDEARRLLLETHGLTDGQVLTVSADVSDMAAVDTAVAAAVDAYGPPDLVVTSAGIARPGRFDELPVDAFRQAMDVNYLGTVHTVKAVMPHMRRRGGGRIVMVSSGAGLIGLFGYTAYAPSKFAVRGFAESLRGELARDGIGVSIVYPPDTDTPQLAEENRYKPPETKRITAEARTWSADDVARVILKGVRRKRFVITPGWEMWALSRLHSLIGSLLQRRFDRLAAAARQQMETPAGPGGSQA